MDQFCELLDSVIDSNNTILQNTCKLNIRIESTCSDKNCHLFQQFVEQVDKENREYSIKQRALGKESRLCYMEKMCNKSELLDYTTINKHAFVIYVYNISTEEIMAVVNCAIYSFPDGDIGSVDSCTRMKYEGLGLNKILRTISYYIMVNNLRCRYLITAAVASATAYIVSEYFGWQCTEDESFIHPKTREKYTITDNKDILALSQKILESIGIIVNFIGDYSIATTNENIKLNKMYQELIQCNMYKVNGGKCSIQ